jgi:hypothetical protein
MKTLTVAAVIAATPPSVAALYQPSSVDASCPDPSWLRPNVPGNWHAGWFREPGTYVHKLTSHIWNYDPFVWPEDDSGQSTAWVLMTDKDEPGTWAQIGYVKRYISGDGPYINTAVQFTTPKWPNFQTYYFPPQTRGTFSEYRVEYWGYFEFWAGQQYYGYAPNYFIPDRGESFGETINLQSQMSGGWGIPNNERFLLSYLDWLPLDGTIKVDYPAWHWASRESPTTLRIWDWACYE